MEARTSEWQAGSQQNIITNHVSVSESKSEVKLLSLSKIKNMKKSIVFIVLSVLASHVFAQQFTPAFTLVLPDSIKSSKAEWVDLDNDGLLDILLIATNDDDEHYFMFVKGDTVNAPVLRTQKTSTIEINAYAITDYDRDNLMDVVASGMKAGNPVTVVYRNHDNYAFVETTLTVPSFTKTLFTDLNNDARKEWILSGGPDLAGYLSIYSQAANGEWNLMVDPMQMKATAIETVDADGNGVHDLFVSGRVSADSLFTGLLFNRGDSLFVPQSRNEWIGTASTGDLNSDGRFDIAFTGKDQAGSRVDKVFTSGAPYIISNESITLPQLSVFLADFNSDGIVDQSFFGKNALNEQLHFIRYAAAEFDTLDSEDVSFVTFGDREHDGDLDVLQVVGTASLQIRFVENNTSKNFAPPVPLESVAVRIFNRVFVYWERRGDDHTPNQSVTYDMYFQENGNDLLASDFDFINEKRLITSHGNNGTYNFKLLRRIPAGNLAFMIQGVDNSLHAKNVCHGSAAAGGCAVPEPQVIFACRAQDMVLTGEPNTLWFSFADGFLGESASLDYNPAGKDTVFSFTPVPGAGCEKISIYRIEMIEGTKDEPTVKKYACTGSTINLSVESSWTSVTWSSKLRGSLGSAQSIAYGNFQQPDSVFVVVTNDEGCSIKRSWALLISKPAVTVAADNFKILKGTQVQLQASGAERYVWQPSAGLNNANIANPLATPVETTQYTVTGYDSLDCSDTAEVTITVEGTGFIPNLFTPNGDGKNDQLRIYGLSQTSDFTFSIFNREGSVVFRTRDVNEAMGQGWDGTNRGVKQPAGVYYWKVKGSLGSGGKLLLNGKDSGSIVLVR
jgi:gliding motility-associated-like protein